MDGRQESNDPVSQSDDADTSRDVIVVGGIPAHIVESLQIGTTCPSCGGHDHEVVITAKCNRCGCEAVIGKKEHACRGNPDPSKPVNVRST